MRRFNFHSTYAVLRRVNVIHKVFAFIRINVSTYLQLFIQTRRDDPLPPAHTLTHTHTLLVFMQLVNCNGPVQSYVDFTLFLHIFSVYYAHVYFPWYEKIPHPVVWSLATHSGKHHESRRYSFFFYFWNLDSGKRSMQKKTLLTIRTYLRITRCEASAHWFTCSSFIGKCLMQNTLLFDKSSVR